MKQYRVDLHTHSKLSPDGSIDEKDYQKVLKTRQLDFVAITDHNTIDYALFCQKKLGQQIIIGEEITTQQGHLIGLFLKKNIEPRKDVLETALEIKSQGGLVYVPHAFDLLRSGIGKKQVKRISNEIDILETCNGRMIIQHFNKQAKKFADTHSIIGGFGSDTHFAGGLGKGAMIISDIPTTNLSSFANPTIENNDFSLLKFFIPKYNRLKKLLSL